MAKKNKKYPFWYESLEGLGRIDDEIRRMMRDLSDQMPRINLEFSKTIPMDIVETDKDIAIRAELPGFSKDEIRLKVSPNSVDISAEKSKVSEDRGENFFRQEKAFGAARKVVSLPSEVSTEGVKAKFEDGVLKVVMQKKEAKKKSEKEIRVE